MIGTTLALNCSGVCRRVRGAGGAGASRQILEDLCGLHCGRPGIGRAQIVAVEIAGLNRKTESRSAGQGIFGTVIVGLLMGGGVAAASLPCNPGIFIVIGASILMGHILLGHGAHGGFWRGFQSAARCHPVRCGVRKGIPQGAEGGSGNPSRRGRSASRCRVLFVGNILKMTTQTMNARNTPQARLILFSAFLEAPTRFLFFYGQGGVGKTSLACASAIAAGG